MDRDADFRKVRADAEALLGTLGDLSDAFHARLFELCPESEALFGPDPEPHCRALEATLAVVLRNLDTVDALRGPLLALGALHAAHGVGPAMLQLSQQILLELIQARIPTPWTRRAEQAWRHALRAAFEPIGEGACAYLDTVT